MSFSRAPCGDDCRADISVGGNLAYENDQRGIRAENMARKLTASNKEFKDFRETLREELLVGSTNVTRRIQVNRVGNEARTKNAISPRRVVLGCYNIIGKSSEGGLLQDSSSKCPCIS